MINENSSRSYGRGEIQRKNFQQLIAAYARVIIGYERRKSAQTIARLKEESRTDPLTGLYNRRGFLERLHQEMVESQRIGDSLCVIMLDVDHFKPYNDEYGHSAGDIVLQKIAQHATVSLRESDVVGRWGGEEFIVLLPHTTLKQGSVVAETLRKVIQKNLVPGNEDIKRKITVSGGIASSVGIVGNQDLIDIADRRLYIAKKKRNRMINKD